MRVRARSKFGGAQKGFEIKSYRKILVGHAISPFWRRSCCLGKLAPDRRCIYYQASLSPPADVGGFMDDLGEAVANSLVQLSISLFVAVLRLVGETPRPCELLLLRPCQVECCRVAYSIPPPFVMTGREQLHNWRVSEQLRTATYARARPNLRLPARGWIRGLSPVYATVRATYNI